ncbi:MAG: TlpA disulfide reductase family protein [bacterium]|nr:TlpA disulfide reductase family protein [bacterium]
MFKAFLTTFLFLFTTAVMAQKTGKPTPKKTTVTSSNTKAKAKVKPVVKGKVSFKIIGKIANHPYHLMVLNRFRSTEYLLLDSITTDVNGNFTMEKTIAEPCIAYLMHSKTAAVPLIIENGSVFNIEIKSTGEMLDYTISGIKAEKSIRLYEFVRNQSKLYNELSNLEQFIYKELDPIKLQEMQLQYSSKQAEVTKNTADELVSSGLEGYFVLYNFKEDQTATDAKKILDKMTPLETQSIYYKDLKKFYDDNKLLEIGALAPDFALPTPNGDTMRLSDLRGKYVLIDFWASWCGPCKAEFPNVKRVYSRFGEQGFEILGVSLDKEETAWKNSIISLGLSWLHVSDLKYWSCAPAKLYKVSSIPSTVLIDRNGYIIAKNLRGEELERKLEELFQ